MLSASLYRQIGELHQPVLCRAAAVLNAAEEGGRLNHENLPHLEMVLIPS
jgi:hypothetical protein